jgi:endonuclease G, mitochondrial
MLSIKKLLLFVILNFSFSTKENNHDPLLYQICAGTVVNHKSYTFCFDDSLKFTKWVSYILTDEMLQKQVCKRTNDFRPDTSVSNSPQLADYKKCGYDRGHLVNAEDMRFDLESESETFYLTNMAPQVPSFNRGIWKKLESQTRTWAKAHKKLYVITGGILKDSIKYIGNKVPVPPSFFKIIYDGQTNTAIAFIMENNHHASHLIKYAVTIDKIENETKIDFLQVLEDSIEARIESRIDTSWFSK